jgi:ferredoxin-type protein NapG
MNAQSKQMNPSRRRFMQETARTVCGVSLLGLGLGVYSRQTHSLPATALRPPGVKTEEEFLAACIRCGLCVRDCPYDILKLATFSDEVALGTPYFTARKIPCEMCEDIPCVKACPTSALDHNLTNIDDARMGLAVIVDQEACLNYQGLRCDVCHRVCPLINKAITLEPRHNQRSGKHTIFIPVVHSDSCTGCGVCERACVLEEAAIKVLPINLAKGEIGKHYRLGWEEKEKAGKSLVTPDEEHKYNLPEGLKYEHAGEGLIQDPGK